MPPPDVPCARRLQVTQDKENDSPQLASESKPTVEQDHAASEQERADGSALHAGGPPSTDGSPQAEPPEGPSPLRPRASPQGEHAGGSVSAEDERHTTTSQPHETARGNDSGCEASVAGDVSDANGSGADVWDEEDELDDAFRQERVAGLTRESSGHGTSAGGEREGAFDALLLSDLDQTNECSKASDMRTG